MTNSSRPSSATRKTASGSARSALFRSGTDDTAGRAFADVSVMAPASLWLSLFVMLAATGALVAAAFIIRVSDSLPATGVLMPEDGFIDVTAPSAGVVSRLQVRPGDDVEADAALVELRREHAAPGEPSLAAQAERRFSEQAQLLADIATRRDRLVSGRLARLERRAAMLRRECESGHEQARLLGETAASLEAHLARLVSLRSAGGVAQDDVERARREWLGARAAELAAKTGVAAREAELAALLGSRDDLAVEAEIGGIEHELRRQDIERLRAEALAESRRSVKAPVAGRVLHVHRTVGDTVAAGARLVSLLPPGRRLEVWLYVDAADAAGLDPGKAIRVRAAALPGERYGSYPATVLSVSRVSIDPGDTPVRAKLRSSVFEIRVRLTAESDRALLEASLPGFGTAFEAAVVRRTPRLVEWAFRALRAGAGNG